MPKVPTNVDRDLLNAAETLGKLHGRNAEQQLDHWARLGRELEASPSLDQDAIALVLAGRASYDDLDASAQAVVRASWAKQIDAARDKLDLTERLRASGRPWYEADADGTLVVRGVDAPPSAG